MPGDYNGNGLAMFDPKAKKVTDWKVPTAWTRPYDAQYDDKQYAWAAGMDADVRLVAVPPGGVKTSCARSPLGV